VPWPPALADGKIFEGLEDRWEGGCLPFPPYGLICGFGAENWRKLLKKVAKLVVVLKKVVKIFVAVNMFPPFLNF
jgi:hypothetical protein